MLTQFLQGFASGRSHSYRLGKRVMICPACGHRTFKPYLGPDEQIISAECGRCNREVKCAYHLPPREWFKNNPTAQRGFGKAMKISPAHNAPVAPSFIPEEQMKRSMQWPRATTPLLTYMLNLFRNDNTTVLTMFDAYNVGDSRYNGGSTVFWLTDSQGRIRSGKVMTYAQDGHRVKSKMPLPTINWAHSVLKIRDFEYRHCFFGATVLAGYPEATAVMVESEKTAVMLAIYLRIVNLFGKYVPVATGGCTQIHFDAMQLADDQFYKWHDLKKRPLLLLPDCDKVDEWKSIARKSQLHAICPDISIYDLRAIGGTGSQDAADFIEKAMLDHMSPLSLL